MDTPPDTVLRWTRFKSDPHGTGPEKRSAQIRALCQTAGIQVEDMQPPSSVSRFKTWKEGLLARIKFGAHASVDRAGVGLLGFRAAFYRQALRSHPGARLLLWETTYDTLLPAFARDFGYRVVALPHNLESLVTESAFADSNPTLDTDLAAEVSRLKRADVVFTISKEEQWFLDAHGIEAHYLPFFPNESLAQECEKIREKRQLKANSAGHVAGPLLILGSAFNPATGRGMALQLTWLASHPSTTPEVVVAGPQTDTLLMRWISPQVRILGAVPRTTLVELLESCSALLIHTQGGAGAVTRIPEALLAGIPVVANINAARDQHGVPGVHVYEDHAEFQSLIRAGLRIPPTPVRPVGAESRFQNTVLRLRASLPPHA